MHHRGLLYRALAPARARTPLSGDGARLHGGRFNPRGVPALYTAFCVVTAVREASQIGTLQPTVLVAYEADIAPVFDAADTRALAAYDMTPEGLAAADWRIAMRGGGKAPTQLLAERLIADGYAGMRVQRFAKGARASDLNLVLWEWGAAVPTRLVLVDDEGRLSQ
ncbi:RES family NAD+ phosphorylase [soil metagenome]